MSAEYQSHNQRTLSPEPAQLFRLAAVVAETAKSQERLRRGLHYDNARFMFIEPIEATYVGDISQQLEGMEHRVRGHIRRIPATKKDPYRQWSFRLAESMWTTHTTSAETRGMSVIYSFEWTERSAVKALRRVRQLPTPDQLELDNMLEHFYLRDDEVSIVAAEDDIRRVSMADCVILEDTLRHLSQRSIELHQADAQSGQR